MTAQLAPPPVFRSWDNLGFPLVGGKLYTYAAGTSIPQATYVDSTQTTQNTNPIILNFRGEAFLWLNPLLAYKFVLQDAFGNLIWTEDNIQGAIGTNSNVIPSQANTFTLGTATISWANAYFGPNNAPILDSTTGNIGYYAHTAAEIAASVVPTNYSYPSHLICGYAHLQRYGGDPSGIASSDAAFVAAAAVAAQLDIPVAIPKPNIGAMWLFNNTWNYMRVVGLANTGYVPVNFVLINNTTDCISGGTIGIQPEFRNLSITVTNGRDVLVISGGNAPIIDNVKITGSFRDSLAISVNTTQWTERSCVDRLTIQSAGRHAMRLETDGAGGAFINLARWRNLNIRGVSKITAGGAGIYLTSTGTAGSIFGSHSFIDCEFDAQYPGSGPVPSGSPIVCDSGNMQAFTFIGCVFENSLHIAVGAGGPPLNLTGTGACSGLMFLDTITNSSWCTTPNVISSALSHVWNFDYSFGATFLMGPATINNSGTGTSGQVLQVTNGTGSQNGLALLQGNTTASGINDIQIQRTGAANSALGRGANLNLVNSTGGTSGSVQEFAGNLILFANGTEAIRATATGGAQIAGICTLYSGAGVPAAGLGANGDFYFNQTGGAGTHIYFKSGGAWAGIV